MTSISKQAKRTSKGFGTQRRQTHTGCRMHSTSSHPNPNHVIHTMEIHGDKQSNRHQLESTKTFITHRGPKKHDPQETFSTGLQFTQVLERKQDFAPSTMTPITDTHLGNPWQTISTSPYLKHSKPGANPECVRLERAPPTT